MDLGERGNHYKALEEEQAQSDFRERSAAKRACLKREREARGLSEDACLYCGEPMEEWRNKLGLPDCEKCRRERSQNIPSVEKVAVLQR
ncbi:MAG TPA: hypothetical protein VMV66_03510 [Candidatus Humimicrobiaceae bacterium]|nr:hypothetical protein [Candidatus Humimicrobiaceae bacterium]